MFAAQLQIALLGGFSYAESWFAYTEHGCIAECAFRSTPLALYTKLVSISEVVLLQLADLLVE